MPYDEGTTAAGRAPSPSFGPSRHVRRQLTLPWFALAGASPCRARTRATRLMWRAGCGRCLQSWWASDEPNCYFFKHRSSLPVILRFTFALFSPELAI